MSAVPASPITPVGALAAQMNSYAKSLVTKVVSCEVVAKATSTSSAKKATPASSGAEKEATPDTYNIVCEDSVLFPEGGGQPYDKGTLSPGDVNVLNVQRQKDVCVLTTDKAVAPGTEVTMFVDWPRRMDHMQHHSAQHLLTAVVEKELNLPTTSWALTSPYCFICVPTAKISEEDVKKVEDICNRMIFEAVGVERRTYESRSEVPPARSRSIPEDFSGPIRLIDIEGVDICACCGTHVNTLGELQMLKILHQEAKGNTCRLHFVTGNRLSSSFGDMYAREKVLAKDLGCGPKDMHASITRRTQDATLYEKKSKKLLTELLQYVAPQVADQVKKVIEDTAEGDDSSKKYFTYIREDGDMDFIMTIATHLTKTIENSKDKLPLCILSAGDLKKENEGQFVIVGGGGDAADDNVKAAGELVKAELDGKGAMSKQGFRGKCNMKKWKAFVKKLNSEAKK